MCRNEPSIELGKCHFIVLESIVLGIMISESIIKVDKANIEGIEKFPPLFLVKKVCKFLRNAGFYRRFIKDFSNISTPFCKLLEKDVKFLFDEFFF